MKTGNENIGEDLSNERRSYEKYHLDERTVTDNPMDLFQNWYNQVFISTPITAATRAAP